jgi:hypothetical protein
MRIIYSFLRELETSGRADHMEMMLKPYPSLLPEAPLGSAAWLAQEHKCPQMSHQYL